MNKKSQPDTSLIIKLLCPCHSTNVDWGTIGRHCGRCWKYREKRHRPRLQGAHSLGQGVGGRGVWGGYVSNRHLWCRCCERHRARCYGGWKGEDKKAFWRTWVLKVEKGLIMWGRNKRISCSQESEQDVQRHGETRGAGPTWLGNSSSCTGLWFRGRGSVAGG